MTDLSKIEEASIMDNETVFRELFAVEKVPVEYFSRFSLCVLDIVRKLQQHSIFEKGVEKCHIVEYLKHQPFIDGDLSSQVSTALRELENYGFLMYVKNGYKTLGPFAKLCISKTPKQRRLAWRKLELKFSHSNTDITLPFYHRKSNRSKSETDFLNQQENCCPQDMEF